MSLGSMLKSGFERNHSVGTVAGSAFPIGTRISIMDTTVDDSGEKAVMAKKLYVSHIKFIYSDDSEETITHDMVKCATILGMGVIGSNATSKQSAIQQMASDVYGVKYLCMFKDGRQAVLTVELPHTGRIESVLF